MARDNMAACMLNDEEHAAYEAAAGMEGLSGASYLRRLLLRDLRAKGFLPEPTPPHIKPTPTPPDQG